MFYTGRTDEIYKVVISDPSYKEGVWCRYENDNIAACDSWKVQLAINQTSEVVEGYEIKGIDFALLLSADAVSRRACQLTKDGSSFSHPRALKIKEYEIGMDTACVALGVNEVAEEIKASIGVWQPGCALRTLTDGFFGNVYDGSLGGNTMLLYVSGFLDEDTGYSVEDVVNYLSSAFKIKDLQLVKDEPAIDEKIAEATSAKEDINLKNKTDNLDIEQER